jgi:hypothetical protein
VSCGRPCESRVNHPECFFLDLHPEVVEAAASDFGEFVFRHPRHRSGGRCSPCRSTRSLSSALVAAAVGPVCAPQPVPDAHDLAAPAARAGGHRVGPPGHGAPTDSSARLADELCHGRHAKGTTRPSFESIVQLASPFASLRAARVPGAGERETRPGSLGVRQPWPDAHWRSCIDTRGLSLRPVNRTTSQTRPRVSGRVAGGEARLDVRGFPQSGCRARSPWPPPDSRARPLPDSPAAGRQLAKLDRYGSHLSPQSGRRGRSGLAFTRHPRRWRASAHARSAGQPSSLAPRAVASAAAR